MENEFRYSYCLPFEEEVIEKGEVSKDQVIAEVKSFPWLQELKKIDEVDEVMFQFPSMEIEHVETGHSINIAIAGDASEYDFTIFYNRPGSIAANDIGVYETEVSTLDEVVEIATAFVNKDIQRLNVVFNAM